MQAWLSLEGIDVATIGFEPGRSALHTFKFLWAPLMDRFDAVAGPARLAGDAAAALALALLAMAAPAEGGDAPCAAGGGGAFLSATQDVVIDAYRTDLLPAPERGLGVVAVGAGLPAMILSGGIALI